MRFIDLRSDTVTLPTQEMREAIYKAQVGDDVYGEDPTLAELEEMSASILGKEAALFVTSGTQGNQISVMSHTHPGDEIIAEERCHILTYEVGGIGCLSGVQARVVRGHNGVMDPDDIEAAIRVDDIHQPVTRLICVENTHNRAGGTVIPLDILRNTYEMANERGIPIHMDGARVFNATAYLKVPVKEIAQYSDSIMFCLSKGLCSPVGSVLAGPYDFIERARRYRKMLGGGMRQAGFLGAAGIIALENMVERLSVDHKNAKLLAQSLHGIPGIVIDMDTVETNIVICDISALGMTSGDLSKKLLEKGIKVNGGVDYSIRFVTHHGIVEGDITRVVAVIKDLLKL